MVASGYRSYETLSSLNICASAFIENNFVDCIVDTTFSVCTPRARDFPFKEVFNLTHRNLCQCILSDIQSEHCMCSPGLSTAISGSHTKRHISLAFCAVVARLDQQVTGFLTGIFNTYSDFF